MLTQLHLKEIDLWLISRAQLAKELEPGLNALFGMEYKGMKVNMLKF